MRRFFSASKTYFSTAGYEYNRHQNTKMLLIWAQVKSFKPRLTRFLFLKVHVYISSATCGGNVSKQRYIPVSSVHRNVHMGN